MLSVDRTGPPDSSERFQFNGTMIPLIQCEKLWKLFGMGDVHVMALRDVTSRFVRAKSLRSWDPLDQENRRS